MRYSKIRKMDISNGPGIRVSLFTQGCPFHCDGCFNKETWDFNGGNEYTEETENKLLSLCNKEQIAGLSILGGEPLIERNLDNIYKLAEKFHKKFLYKDIWLWTGFMYGRLSNKQKEALKYIDVLIDGQFDKTKQDFNLKFKGSTNQRIIDVKQSMQKGVCVLRE